METSMLSATISVSLNDEFNFDETVSKSAMIHENKHCCDSVAYNNLEPEYKQFYTLNTTKHMWELTNETGLNNYEEKKAYATQIADPSFLKTPPAYQSGIMAKYNSIP